MRSTSHLCLAALVGSLGSSARSVAGVAACDEDYSHKCRKALACRLRWKAACGGYSAEIVDSLHPAWPPGALLPSQLGSPSPQHDVCLVAVVAALPAARTLAPWVPGPEGVVSLEPAKAKALQ